MPKSSDRSFAKHIVILQKLSKMSWKWWWQGGRYYDHRYPWFHWACTRKPGYRLYRGKHVYVEKGLLPQIPVKVITDCFAKRNTIKVVQMGKPTALGSRKSRNYCCDSWGRSNGKHTSDLLLQQRTGEVPNPKAAPAPEGWIGNYSKGSKHHRKAILSCIPDYNWHWLWFGEWYSWNRKQCDSRIWDVASGHCNDYPRWLEVELQSGHFPEDCWGHVWYDGSAIQIREWFRDRMGLVKAEIPYNTYGADRWKPYLWNRGTRSS